MNTLVQGALNKLIQDETFRAELLGMLDGVNRASGELISREQAEQQPEPEQARAEEPSVANFTDIKDDLLKDPAFLKSLVDALMAISKPDDEERAKSDKTLRESIDALSRTVSELGTTITEHDAVLTQMAEKALIAEGEKPVLLRARGNEQPNKPDQSTLEDRATRVLTKMGGTNA